MLFRSKIYLGINVLSLLLCLSLFIYILIDPPEHLNNKIVFSLELLLSGLIFIDIIMRIGLKGLNYFKNIWNIIDIVSFIILIILFTVFYVGKMDKNNAKNISDDL